MVGITWWQPGPKNSSILHSGCRVFAKMGLDRGPFFKTVLLRIKNGGSSEESCDAHHKCEKSRRIRQALLY